jgi:hypothetical protein
MTLPTPVIQLGDNYSAACSCREEDACFEYGEDAKTLRVLENCSRDDLD